MPIVSNIRYKSGKGKSVKLENLRIQNNVYNKKNNTKFSRRFLIYALFVFSLIFLFVFLGFKNINKNFVYAKNDSIKSSLYYNFLYLSVDDINSKNPKLTKLSFVLIDKITNNTIIFDLPLNYEFDIPGRYNKGTLQQAFNLGGLKNTDKLVGGVNLIDLSVLKILASKSSAFIVIDSTLQDSFENLLYSGSENFILSNIYSLIGKNLIRTNMDLITLFEVQNDLKKNLLQKRQLITFNENIDDYNYVDSFFESISLSSKVAQKKEAISILNGSGVNGIASFGSRLIKNNGGRVVAIENANKFYDKSVIITHDKDSEATNFIKNSLNIDNVILKSELSDLQESSISRSDVILIIGIDITDLL